MFVGLIIFFTTKSIKIDFSAIVIWIHIKNFSKIRQRKFGKSSLRPPKISPNKKIWGHFYHFYTPETHICYLNFFYCIVFGKKLLLDVLTCFFIYLRFQAFSDAYVALDDFLILKIHVKSRIPPSWILLK